MDHLNVYMEVLSLPHDMRVRFRRYFMQCKDVFEHDFHKSVMARMSPGLRGEFANFVHRKWISRVSFFCKSPSESHGFVTDLAMCFQVQAYPAGECIVQLNEYAECMYIIQRGLAARLGKIMSKGKVFGEDIILTDGIRHYTVRSLTFVNCLMMTKGDLTAILSSGKFPETSAIIRRAAVKLAIRREFIAYASAIAALGIRGASNSLHKSKTYSMGLSTSGSQRRPSSFPFHNQMTELWERSNTLNAQQMNEISSVSEEQEEGAKNSARTEDPDTNTARESDVGPSDSSRAVEMMQFTKESNDSVQGKQYTNEAHTHFTTYANSKTAFGNAAIASEGSDEGKHYAFREVDSTYNTRNGDKHKRKQPIANPRYSLNPSLSPHYHTSNELLLEVLANQEEIKNSIESSVGEMQRQIVSVKSVVNDLLHHVVAGVSKSEASMAAEFRRDRRASFYKYHSTMGMPVTGKGGYPQSLSRDRQGKRERGRERNQDRGRYNRRSLSEPRNRDRYRQDHHYSDNSPPLSRHNHEQRDDNNRRHQHQYHPHNEEPSQYGNNRLYDNANNYVGHNQYTDYDNHRHQQEHYYHRPPNQTSDFRNRYDSNHKYEHSSHHNDSLHHHLRQQVHAQSDIRHMAQSAPSSLPPHASHASHALQHDTLAPPPIARVLGLHTPEKIDSLRHVTPTTATTSKSTPTHTPLVFPLRRQASNVAAQDNDNELLTTGLSLPLTFTLQTRTQAVEAERRKGNIIK